MTLQHFLRTSMVPVLGAAALILTTQAKAEGSDGSGVVSPEQAQEFLNMVAAPAEVSAGPKAAGPARNAKAARGHEKPKSKAAAAPEANSKSAGAEDKTADASDKEEVPNVEQTAAIPLVQGDALLKGRQADALRSATLKPLITRYAVENGVPYHLADAVIRLESRYNPGARRGPNMGLTQINVRTAQSLGYEGAATGLLDAETNLRYGLKYLAQAYRLAGGDTCGTILRYQFGHRAQTMTSASRTYCAKVKVISAAAE